MATVSNSVGVFLADIASLPRISSLLVASFVASHTQPADDDRLDRLIKGQKSVGNKASFVKNSYNKTVGVNTLMIP